ncbi:MAG: hypothetical protein AAFY98_10635 [Verrucomicrobiota bacterium]
MTARKATRLSLYYFLYSIAWILYKIKKRKWSKKISSLLVNRFPGHWKPYRLLSRACQALQDHDTALDSALAAYRLNPECSVLRDELVSRIKNTGRLDVLAALDDIEHAISLPSHQTVTIDKEELRVSLDFHPGVTFTAKANALLSQHQRFRQHGIFFTRKEPTIRLIGGKPAFVMKQLTRLEHDETHCILLESTAACSTDFPLEEPFPDTVKALFRPFTFRDTSYRQSETCLGLYHYAIMGELEAYQEPVRAECEWGNPCQFTSASKPNPVPIFAVPWDFRMSPLYQFDLYPQVTTREREIDVNCMVSSVHTGLCPEGLYALHRLKAIEALHHLSTKHGIIVRTEHCPRSEYVNYMLSTKTCLSPWGKGEFAFRDYEAILSGSLLIKPYSPWIQSEPDIYNEECLVWCNPDYSNLEELLLKIRNGEIDSDTIIQNGQKKLKAFHIPHWVSTVAQAIHSVMEDNNTRH